MRLGIDFGTTRTAVATVDRGNYPVVAFHDGRGDVYEHIPSIVALDDNGHAVFGFEAERLACDGAPYLRSLKRLMGDPHITTASTVRLAHRDLNLFELLCGYLAYIRDSICHRSSVSEVDDDEVLDIAIGIPAHAYSAQRFLTLEAFRAAGFSPLLMINEPSAAAFEYTNRYQSTLNSRRQQILVYDLGGGTFDVSLVHVTGKYHEILGSRGNNLLGGDDFDAVLANCALKVAELRESDITDVQYIDLLEQARNAKESLTPQSRNIILDINNQSITVPISTFYEAVTPLVESTLDTMDPFLVTGDDGERQFDDHVAGLYVVGGGSQLPIVGRVLRSHFKHRVHNSPHRGASTAIGLAISVDPESGFILQDQLSRGVGVFREMESGQRVSFDTILSPTLRVSPDKAVSVTRTYQAVHNIGWFRFVEYTKTDPDGVPRGDVLPYGEIIFPFDPQLQHSSMTDRMNSISIIRSESGPTITECYTVDSNGILEVSITDNDTGYSMTQSLGH